jgi:hypothetical protein
MKTTTIRLIAAAFKRSEIISAKGRQDLKLGLILLAAFFATNAVHAQAKGKKGKAVKATVAEKPAESPSAGVATPVQEERTPTRWSDSGINLGVYGAYTNPSVTLNGAPDSFKLEKEAGYSYGAKLSYQVKNVYNWFTAFDAYEYKFSGNQNGLSQKYVYSGYKAVGGLELTGFGMSGLQNPSRVSTGFSYSLLIGGGFHLPTKATVEIDGKVLDRSAFVNTAAGFVRLGLNIYYVFSAGVNLGLGYHYDWMGRIEKKTDTGDEHKIINSHNFHVFVDARILNFGSNTYARD